MKKLVKTNFRHIVSALLILIMAFSIDVVAQPGMGRMLEGRNEQLKAKKVSFLTDKMDLTIQEAQVFWPLYNEFNDKRDSLIKSKVLTHRCENLVDEMTESELLEIMEAEISNSENMAALRREYHEKFLKILPVEKVARLYIAEKEFNRQLFREMRKRGHREKRP